MIKPTEMKAILESGDGLKTPNRAFTVKELMAALQCVDENTQVCMMMNSGIQLHYLNIISVQDIPIKGVPGAKEKLVFLIHHSKR